MMVRNFHELGLLPEVSGLIFGFLAVEGAPMDPMSFPLQVVEGAARSLGP
jgi:hypothetical protein